MRTMRIGCGKVTGGWMAPCSVIEGGLNNRALAPPETITRVEPAWLLLLNGTGQDLCVCILFIYIYIYILRVLFIDL